MVGTEADPHRLDPDRVATFERDGFVAGIPVLSGEEVRALRIRLDEMVARLDELRPHLYEVEAAWTERPGEVICHFLGGWLVDDRLRALVFDPRLTVPCAQLLQVERLRFWHDQVFCKPPRHPGVVPFHQDYSYWTRTGPAAHITINIMLDDADEESGCVQFAPGTHRWGLLPRVAFDAPVDAILAHLTPEQTVAFAAVPACLRAGEATIHHSHTLHGSAGNRSSRPRRALVFNYMAADTRVMDGSQPLLRHTPQLATGAIVAGEHFPIVLEARPESEDRATAGPPR